jgi:hypothetical protein
VAASRCSEVDLPSEADRSQNRAVRRRAAPVRRPFATAAFVLGPAALALSSAPEKASPAPDAGRRVVLELFTSQGCSSCPAAERVLSRIGLEEEVRARVVPLAFHVDYWDDLGWRDPFSAREWTQRQIAYGRRLGVDAPYTPQLVVDGRTQLNGGDAARVRAEVAASLEAAPAASISIARREDPARSREIAVVVAAAVSASVEARKLDAVVALYESGLETPVARGENGGRTLRNDFVVRRLKTAFSLEPKPGGREERVVRLELEPAWKPENLGVAAFLQDPKSLRIYAATAVGSVH